MLYFKCFALMLLKILACIIIIIALLLIYVHCSGVNTIITKEVISQHDGYYSFS